MRYYIGVDWADAAHAIWVEAEDGTPVLTRTIPHTPEGLADWGRWLDEQRARGIELWAAVFSHVDSALGETTVWTPPDASPAENRYPP